MIECVCVCVVCGWLGVGGRPYCVWDVLILSLYIYKIHKARKYIEHTQFAYRKEHFIIGIYEHRIIKSFTHIAMKKHSSPIYKNLFQFYTYIMLKVEFNAHTSRTTCLLCKTLTRNERAFNWFRFIIVWCMMRERIFECARERANNAEKDSNVITAQAVEFV